jgi:hypothetical protein
MKQFFRKTILFAVIAALAVASLPFVSVSAAGEKDPSTLPQVTNERLENIWARQLRAYERMGHTDEFIARVQKLIDRAEENGKDASAVQAALDAFAEQAKEAQPVYESIKGIINSHQGFDENGKVTDPEKAKETIRSMHEKLQEIRKTMDGTGKALRDAIKAFREANPRPEKTPTPTGS